MNETKTKICKIQTQATQNPPCMATVPGIAYCPEYGTPMCPICRRHNVSQISRVTGYISTVSGWNEGKKQELKDRKRYALERV